MFKEQKTVRKGLYSAVGAICVSLLLMAVVGNLFLGNVPEQEHAVLTVAETDAASEILEEQYTREQMAKAVLVSEGEPAERNTDTQSETTLQNHVAALRMERDSSWQRLRDRIDRLSEIQQQKLETYALLQYKEQRLELLLQARGLEHCLVVLEEQQANVIASEEALAEQYEKIYDLVQRNTDYAAEQIVLVPLKTER